MKLTASPTETLKITRYLDIADGPVVTEEYKTTSIRVDMAIITYTWIRDAWKVTQRYDIELKGYRVKKDGTDSVVRGDTRPKSTSWDSPDFTEEFAWLDAVINLARPVNQLSFLVLNDTEVRHG